MNGNATATGALEAQTLDNIRIASQFAGSDCGAKINAADATLKTTATAYSVSGTTLTVTAPNSFIAGQFVYLSPASTDPLAPVGGGYHILSAGLSSTQFEVTIVSGSLTGSGTTTSPVYIPGEIWVSQSCGTAWTTAVSLSAYHALKFIQGGTYTTTQKMTTGAASSMLCDAPAPSGQSQCTFQAAAGAGLSGMIDAGSQMTIRDMAIDGNQLNGGTTGLSAYLVNLHPTAVGPYGRQTLDNDTFENSSGNGILIPNGTVVPKFSRLIVNNNNADGISCNGTADVFISDTEFEDNGLAGVELNNCGAARINHSDFGLNMYSYFTRGAGYGALYIHGPAGTDSSGDIITSNQFGNDLSPAIYIQGTTSGSYTTTSHTIVGNSFIGNLNGAATVTSYSGSGGTLTLTAPNSFTPGEQVMITAKSSDALAPISGSVFAVQTPSYTPWVTITGYSGSGGVLTLTAANTYGALQPVVIKDTNSSDPCYPLNGVTFPVLARGLSTSQFAIVSGAVTGTGSCSSATALAVIPAQETITPITAYSASGGTLTFTALNKLSAGQMVQIQAASTDPLSALNGLNFMVLSAGLSGTQFEITTSLVTGSGSSSSSAITGQFALTSNVSISAYSGSGGVLTLTGYNAFGAGQTIIISAGASDPLSALNGLTFTVSSTGLKATQFQISTSAVTGSGATTASASPNQFAISTSAVTGTGSSTATGGYPNIQILDGLGHQIVGNYFNFGASSSYGLQFNESATGRATASTVSGNTFNTGFAGKECLYFSSGCSYLDMDQIPNIFNSNVEGLTGYTNIGSSAYIPNGKALTWLSNTGTPIPGLFLDASNNLWIDTPGTTTVEGPFQTYSSIFADGGNINTTGIYEQNGNNGYNGTFNCGTNQFVSSVPIAGGIVLQGAPPTCTTPATQLPIQVAAANATGQSADIATTLLYTVPTGQGGMYRVSEYGVVTTGAGTSSALPNLYVSFTDADTSAPVNGLWTTGNQTGNYVGATVNGAAIINAKAGTSIYYGSVNYASSGTPSMQYAAHIKLEFVGN